MDFDQTTFEKSSTNITFPYCFVWEKQLQLSKIFINKHKTGSYSKEVALWIWIKQLWKVIHKYNILSLLCLGETALTCKDLCQQTHNCSSYSREVNLWILIKHLLKTHSQIQHFVTVVFGRNSFTCQRSWSTDTQLQFIL